MSVETLDLIAKDLTIVFGFPMLLIGTIGNLMNIVVFLSLKTFRENSCAFYLMIMSIVNTGQLLTGLLTRLMSITFGIEWTQLSLVYCKLRYYIFSCSSLISFSCFCLATVDQYFASCVRPRWQRWSNIKLAHRLTSICCLIWSFHGIIYLVKFIHVNTAFGQVACIPTDAVFIQYHLYVNSLLFNGFIPVLITVIFGSLAYHNVRTMSYRVVPLVRRELDKQLTVMVLVQVLINFFTILPFIIIMTISLKADFNAKTVAAAQFRLITYISVLLYYLYFASPFFIFVSASERFRRQLIYVLIKVLWSKRRRRRVVPHIISLEPVKSSYDA